eukprot:Clim_evm60s134 gene=Clim_evmTU60s134
MILLLLPAAVVATTVSAAVGVTFYEAHRSAAVAAGSPETTAVGVVGAIGTFGAGIYGQKKMYIDGIQAVPPKEGIKSFQVLTRTYGSKVGALSLAVLLSAGFAGTVKPQLDALLHTPEKHKL